ncbi:MAG: hypothetical protein ACI9UT_003632 [Flavobacteriales bacterium]
MELTRTNNPGFVEALKDFVKSTNYYPPNGMNFSLADVNNSFGFGEAFLQTVGMTLLFKR